ncbi:MAG: enoyl-CoA hydratase/isomerase family protein [Bdellovibrionales bacterium]
MAPHEIKPEARGNALIVSFNRPDHGNALTLDMANQLFSTLKNATTDRSIRAILLRGNGGTFMNGYDMAPFAGDFNAALELTNQLMLPYHSAIRELQTMDKPVVAAIEGMAAGPGFSLMAASDIIVCGRSAKFNCGYASNAMTPDGGCSIFLARKVGMAKANELLMLSETFGAAEAERWGLAGTVVEDDKLQDHSLALIDRLAAGPTRAYGGIKKLVAKAFEQDVNTQLALEHTYWGASARSFDFREFIRAHFAKRPTKYTGT